MSPFPTITVRDNTGRAYLTIYTGDGELPPVVADDHPHFDALLKAADDPDATAADIRELADLSEAVAAWFNKLSDRVAVANGRVYFDGDELDDSITRHIVRCLESGEEDWIPYVLFLENIANNPNPHSREQLFDWLRAHEFTINEAGEIIGYKGVARNADGTYSPTYGSGYAIVDGERQESIQQREGSTVELPRSEVKHDPKQTCEFGLHVGTYAYAQGFAHGVVLKVAVNPRDVVSVPDHAGGAKVRACRYRVLEAVEQESTVPVEHGAFHNYSEYEEEYEEERGGNTRRNEEEWYCEQCGTELDPGEEGLCEDCEYEESLVDDDNATY